MKKDILYKWGEDHLEIDMGNRVEPRVKIILIVEFAVTAVMASVFLLRAFQVAHHLVGSLLFSGACLLYILASYRLISRISFREKIIITPSHFTLINRTPVCKKTYSYDWRCIGILHYIGKDIGTQHSHMQSYDPFGLERQDRLAHDLHHDGNLFFTYKDEPVRFARCIYSWHAEEIVRMIQLYAGSNLKLGAELEYLLEASEWEE